ncbi:MAG: helix-turn-helix domain-containing protein [Bacteroidetes bacterium]|nr:helix-turn-helix domain-containing protein [Bacteroidota bacterium]MBL7105501.1 helix-turn-helix domain-containing protein [Bacteroidales bacterium]
MSETAIIVTQKENIKEILKAAMIEIEKEKEDNRPDKLYTINQVAKRLGRAHETISKLVKRGVIRSTKDGLITESAINDYLGQ